MRIQQIGKKPKVLGNTSRYRMTLQALDDVTAERLHDHAEIKAWAQSIGKAKRATRR